MANKIFSKLQSARVKVQESGLKKTGWNEYGKFHYFQLEDFEPAATKAFQEVNLCPIFTTKYNENGERIAELKLVDGDNPEDSIVFTVPFAESNASKNPAQALGSTITYLRRYLSMMCLDISETDIIDASSGSQMDANGATKKPEPQKKTAQAKKEEPKAEPKKQEQPKEEPNTEELATREQIGIIRNLLTAEQIQKSFDKYGKNKLEDLTIREASLMIQAANKKKVAEQKEGEQ